jgi:hypothetical protein
LAVSSKLNPLFKVLIYSVPCWTHLCMSDFRCYLWQVKDKFIPLVVLGACWYLRGTLVNSSNRFLLGSTKLHSKEMSENVVYMCLSLIFLLFHGSKAY